MTFVIAGRVEVCLGDRILLDEAHRLYYIPDCLHAQFPVGEVVVAEVKIPLSASLSFEGEVVGRPSGVTLEDVQDNHLMTPSHPAIRAIWETELERDRVEGHGCDMYQVEYTSRSASGVHVSTTYECRSVRAARVVLAAYQSEQGNTPLSAPCFRLENGKRILTTDLVQEK